MKLYNVYKALPALQSYNGIVTVIINRHLNHDQRNEWISQLKDLLAMETNTIYDMTRQQELLDFWKPFQKVLSNLPTSQLTHTQVRQRLQLFQDMCTDMISILQYRTQGVDQEELLDSKIRDNLRNNIPPYKGKPTQHKDEKLPFNEKFEEAMPVEPIPQDTQIAFDCQVGDHVFWGRHGAEVVEDNTVEKDRVAIRLGDGRIVHAKLDSIVLDTDWLPF